MKRRREQFTTILEAIRPDNSTEQNFALVLNAPSEIAQALNDVRRRYDPAHKVGISPHITIKRPALVGDPARVSEIRRVLRETLQDFPAIKVQLQGYDFFKIPDRNVVFLKVQDEQPFCELHNRIITALSQIYPNGQADQYEGSQFHPHLTIGNELNALDLAVLEYELSNGGYQLEFAFTLRHVDLFVNQAGQPWQVVESFQFL